MDRQLLGAVTISDWSLRLKTDHVAPPRLNRDHLLKHREVLSAEDWAEIRRLRRAEGMAFRPCPRRC